MKSLSESDHQQNIVEETFIKILEKMNEPIIHTNTSIFDRMNQQKFIMSICVTITPEKISFEAGGIMTLPETRLLKGNTGYTRMFSITSAFNTTTKIDVQNAPSINLQTDTTTKIDVQNAPSINLQTDTSKKWIFQVNYVKVIQTWIIGAIRDYIVNKNPDCQDYFDGFQVKLDSCALKFSSSHYKKKLQVPLGILTTILFPAKSDTYQGVCSNEFFILINWMFSKKYIKDTHTKAAIFFDDKKIYQLQDQLDIYAIKLLKFHLCSVKEINISDNNTYKHKDKMFTAHAISKYLINLNLNIDCLTAAKYNNLPNGLKISEGKTQLANKILKVESIFLQNLYGGVKEVKEVKEVKIINNDHPFLEMIFKQLDEKSDLYHHLSKLDQTQYDLFQQYFNEFRLIYDKFERNSVSIIKDDIEAVKCNYSFSIEKVEDKDTKKQKETKQYYCGHLIMDVGIHEVGSALSISYTMPELSELLKSKLQNESIKKGIDK